MLQNRAKLFFTRQANSKHRKLSKEPKKSALLCDISAKNPLTFIYAKKSLKAAEK